MTKVIPLLAIILLWTGPADAQSEQSEFHASDLFMENCIRRDYDQLSNLLFTGIKSGTLDCYRTPAMDTPVPANETDSLFHFPVPLLLPDPIYGIEMMDTVLNLEMGPGDWQGLGFVDQGIRIRAYQDHYFYVREQAVRAAVPELWERLTWYRNMDHAEVLYRDSLTYIGRASMDSLEKRLYDLVYGLKIPAYKRDMLQQRLSPEALDTAFDREEYLLIEEEDESGTYFTDLLVMVEFEHYSINGLSFSARLEQKGSAFTWQIEYLGLSETNPEYGFGERLIPLMWLPYDEVMEHLDPAEQQVLNAFIFTLLLESSGDSQD